MKIQGLSINLVSAIQLSLKSAGRTPVDVTVSVSGCRCSEYVTVNVNRLFFTNRVKVYNYFNFTSISWNTYKSIYESLYFGLFTGF